MMNTFETTAIRTFRAWTVAAAIVVMCLTRAGADGAPDMSFGANGTVITDFAGAVDHAKAAAVDASGRIVVAGQVEVSARRQFGLARYNPDGALDTSFGVGGKVTTDFGLGSDAYDVAIDASGRIVVAGSAWMAVPLGDGATFYSHDFALARFNEDGSLDSTFGPAGNGKVTTALPGSASEFIFDLLIDGDGRLVVTGVQMASGQFAVARYQPDGALDGSFGDGGIVRTAFPTASYSHAVALDGYGRIIVAGWSANPADNSSDLALARYEVNGDLDATFGSGGVVVSDLGASALPRAVAIDGNGRIVVAGVSGTAFLIARYTPDGVLDAALGGSGYVVTDVGGLGNSAAHDLAIDANGRIVAAGVTIVPEGTNVISSFALARYLEDGTLDASFGSGGRLTTAFPGYSAAESVVLDRDGQLVVAGMTGDASETGYPSTRNFAVARYVDGAAGYRFSGFFAPVDNAPAYNVVKAGGAVPVKFSLGGDYGLDILAAGSPSSQPIACDAGAPIAIVDETVAAGESRLTYDAEKDQYVFVWKTQKGWAHSCRQLIITLNDGTSHVANFSFSK